MSLLKCRLYNNLNEKIPKPVQTCGRDVVMHNLPLKPGKAVHTVEFIISTFIPHSSSKLETYVFLNLRHHIIHFFLLHQKLNTGFSTSCHSGNLFPDHLINHTQSKLVLLCSLQSFFSRVLLFCSFLGMTGFLTTTKPDNSTLQH